MITLIRWLLIVVGLVLVSACEFSGTFTSAQLGPLKFYKDEEGKFETSTFSPNDNIYIKASVSNVPSGGITLRYRIFPEGQEAPAMEKYIEVPEDGVATFTLTPNSQEGMRLGKFRTEVSRLVTVEEKTNGTYIVQR